ncbi:DUF975 family protein [Enterococcus faecalis]|uniref:DUF975 family protein n=1 Tax=Enterococcus faecalis TaxID=1351 RepID=UPI000CF21AFA|nr:DUF975 family protein [Enterococcus faecalis]PQE78652.1 hypothetical protein CUT00_05485 [Enterococcus faecalis]
MKSLVTNSQHRANARRALDGQWGIMAWLTFLGVVLQSFLTSIVQNLFPGENQVFQSSFAAVLLQIFVLFALSYALYYAALKVLRGEKVRVNILMSVFQGKYYGPLFVVNLLQKVLERVIGLLFLLPILFGAGTTLYFKLMFNTVTPEEIQTFFLNDFSFFLAFGVATILIFLIGLFVSGVFQFAVWLRFDNPELPIMMALKQALYLMKNRFWQYLCLQFSFIGWYIVGFLAIGIGLLWVIPYNYVALASFYQTALEEKGLAEE